jgi:hypothetical protein
VSTENVRRLLEVVPAACERVASFLASCDVPADREETDLAGLSPIETADFYLFLVAICHQTSPLGKIPLQGTVEGRLRKGWDFLLWRFRERVLSDRTWLKPTRWLSITAWDIASLFTGSQDSGSLVDPGRRADLVADLGRVMHRMGWAHAWDLYTLSAGQVASSPNSLIESLCKFEAYNDPVHKKTFYLLALMRNHGLWSYADPMNLGPPVDYHEVRGHLRLGTVRILDEDLRRKIKGRKVVSRDEDISIRKAVQDAILLISKRSQLYDPSRLHYLFWNVFRSCCTRDNPHCEACPPTCTLPVRYVQLAIDSLGRRHCPFAAVCEAAAIPAERQLVEHVVSPSYDYH